MEKNYKLYDFNIYNEKINNEEDDCGHSKDTSVFTIQMFGINENGKSASIITNDYAPFFYIRVGNKWGQKMKNDFRDHISAKIGNYYDESIIDCKLIAKRKLVGFDNCAKHRFIILKFANSTIFNKVKNLWYQDIINEEGDKERKLIDKGYYFKDCYTELYEANIPPLLRYFHVKEVSPSGWISLPMSKTTSITGANKTTSCDDEFRVSYHNIIPLNNKETIVPYKIMSVDIEASSSHGDFPVPIKSYKKLATNIVDYFEKNVNINVTKDECINILKEIVKYAFGFGGCNNDMATSIDLVYLKTPLKEEDDISHLIDCWLKTKVRDRVLDNNEEHLIERLFESANQPLQKETEIEPENNNIDSDSDDDVNEELPNRQYQIKSGYNEDKYKNQQSTIVDIMCDKKFVREGKINELIFALRNNFTQLEGDKVTFIGSTFFKYGDNKPYLNHCIVLNSCDSLALPNSQIETYDTEKEVLLAWTRLVQRENPDIVIGYNIFSFDYEFMFRRAQELKCVEEFLKLSKNKNEVCASTDYKTHQLVLEKSSITLASGTHDMSIIKMNGRLQIDMLNWFRKTEILSSYKLDYVSGYFIGDIVNSLEHYNIDVEINSNITRIKTNNLTGLLVDSYIHFEEINHSSDYYKNGAKFKVININNDEKWFEIKGTESPQGKKVKWGLAKDDVTPKDIFRMSNEGSTSRAIVAKYCIQDCNLVHYLFNKVDVITDLVEMSKLCSVPMSFLIFRGQGIKLTSYVAKKCREHGVLMPVINKGSMDDGYEGAIVLEPKCGLYLDEPVAVVDFASLYPSSMLSENLCPSTKVWVKIYDLAGNLVYEEGEKDINCGFIYDNLPGIEYVNIKFDTYKYVRKTPKGKAEKILSGFKVCRYAQPTINQDGLENKGIMPSILQELLKARKDTRKMIPQAQDAFIKNVLNKRQLAYKVTANSLYGQLGAKTSTFYEPDIAASTTATGRLLLIYAKRVIEECYDNVNLDTQHGLINTTAEHVYGDTDSVFFKFNLVDKTTGDIIKGHKALELSIEIAQSVGHTVTKFLKQPHDLEYEYMPFCLLSKKRYVGILYEKDANKGKRNEMGIVLKRRDNAPIVKDIYGGVIDILMKEVNIKSALEFINKSLRELVDGNISMDKLIITKSIRSFYKNPKSIAHKVLADRIGDRESGNKPTSGDRIPFVYFVNKLESKNNKLLQGDKIETPTFVKENNLSIDYSFYITNQIMKPLLQLFGLVLNDIWKSLNKEIKISKFNKEIIGIRKTIDDFKKCEKKISKLRDKEVKAILFDKYLIETNNAKNGNQGVANFFPCKNK